MFHGELVTSHLFAELGRVRACLAARVHSHCMSVTVTRQFPAYHVLQSMISVARVPAAGPGCVTVWLRSL
jgi:hypothetical protein